MSSSKKLIIPKGFLAFKKSQKENIPKGFLPSKKPWEQSKPHKALPPVFQPLNRSDVERSLLDMKKKHDWTNAQIQKTVDGIMKARQRMDQIKANRHPTKMLNKPIGISVFQKSKQTKSEQQKKTKKESKTSKADAPRCAALKMNGKVCGALLKDGNKFCGRHRKKA